MRRDQLDDLGIAAPDRPRERVGTFVVGNRRVGVAVEQRADDRRVCAIRRRGLDQRGRAVELLADVRIGAASEQERDRIGPAHLRGPHQRRHAERAGLLVDVGATIDQQLHHVDVAARRGEHERLVGTRIRAACEQRRRGRSRGRADLAIDAPGVAAVREHQRDDLAAIVAADRELERRDTGAIGGIGVRAGVEQ